MQLEGKLIQAAALSADMRDQMFALMDASYEGVSRANFTADLSEKEWVIQLFDRRTRELCGFSTQMLLPIKVADRSIWALFSGDTIISREHWGDTALSHVWGRLALSLIDRLAGAELYWFLISQGYKTYRFLPLFFHEFYPRHDQPTPDAMRSLLDAIAVSRYSREYDASNGVIRAAPSQYRLRPGLADITPERLCDPHVRFFQARNPGHLHGDELCCLAPLTRANFTRAAYRVIGREPVALETP
jgi:hypothetical protein